MFVVSLSSLCVHGWTSRSLSQWRGHIIRGCQGQAGATSATENPLAPVESHFQTVIRNKGFLKYIGTLVYSWFVLGSTDYLLKRSVDPLAGS